MDDETLERLVKSGLEIAPAAQNGNQNMVQIVLDGKPQTVPADVGIYMAVSNMNAMLQAIMLRLDALHSHERSRTHANTQARNDCPACRAQDMTPEELEEIRAQMLAEQEQQQEESQEQEQVDS